MALKLVIAAVAIAAGAYAYLRWVWFYRDPVRTPPADPAAIVSPVDGKIIYVRPVRDGQVTATKLGRPIRIPEITWAQAGPREGWLVGIYMSPLDVHYVYAPADGQIDHMVYHQGKKNWPMVDLWEYIRLTWVRRAVDLMHKRFHLENERLTIRLSTASGELWLVEIADLFVNKIRTFVQPGDRVKAGQKLSFISRGSQVDLFLPSGFSVTVKPGAQVYGAKTVVARGPGYGHENRTGGNQ